MDGNQVCNVQQFPSAGPCLEILLQRQNVKEIKFKKTREQLSKHICSLVMFVLLCY